VLMVETGVDKDGRITYELSAKEIKCAWSEWPSRFMVIAFEKWSPADDLYGFAAHLYEEKQDKLANRVLTALHERPDLKARRALIEDYVKTKEHIAAAASLVLFNDWDDDFRVERQLLVEKAEAAKRQTVRDDAAE